MAATGHALQPPPAPHGAVAAARGAQGALGGRPGPHTCDVEPILSEALALVEGARGEPGPRTRERGELAAACVVPPRAGGLGGAPVDLGETPGYVAAALVAKRPREEGGADGDEEEAPKRLREGLCNEGDALERGVTSRGFAKAVVRVLRHLARQCVREGGELWLHLPSPFGGFMCERLGDEGAVLLSVLHKEVSAGDVRACLRHLHSGCGCPPAELVLAVRLALAFAEAHLGGVAEVPECVRSLHGTAGGVGEECMAVEGLCMAVEGLCG